MSIILSLQGCMAVGKTTAIKYIQENAPYVNISYELNQDVIKAVRKRKLDKNKFEDYLEIQKLWIDKEIVRWEKAQQYHCCIMDFGAEEIEFYTLNYPSTINLDWNVEKALHNDLERLRKCLPNRILFLNASEETVKKNKENDGTRRRLFFEHHIKYLLPLKKAWFINKDNVDILNIDCLSKSQVGEKVKAWIDKWIVLL